MDRAAGKRTGAVSRPTDQRITLLPIPSWVRPYILDLGCCGTSALQIGAPGCGLPGFDGRAYDLAPEQANVLIVAGRVSLVFAPILQALFKQIAFPGWVIAYGTCAVSGAVFETLPAGQAIPVDIAVPGCPPHPNALCDALAHLSRRRIR
jgi:NADH-quinone oxidoreductase subunit B